MLYKTLREAEGRIVIGSREKEGRRGVKRVGISVGVFSVKITVKNKAHALDFGQILKGIGNRLVRLSKVAVVVAPNSAVDAV